MLAEILDINLIRSTLDTQYGNDANVIRREAARLCLTMPLAKKSRIRVPKTGSIAVDLIDEVDSNTSDTPERPKSSTKESGFRNKVKK